MSQQIKKIDCLTGFYIEAKLNSNFESNDFNENKVKEPEKLDSTKEFHNKGKNVDEEQDVCCNMYLISNPCFLIISILVGVVSLLLFLYLINMINRASNPEEIEVNQSDLMLFDYLVTDIFTIHNSTISSHGREFNINFNNPFGVNFNNMSILPDGTILATNCNFSELMFKEIKIRGSTILSITPQNDEVIFNLPTIYMEKSLKAMELDCSGFLIKNGKLFDSTGSELTWPSPGDSRYSFLTNSQLLDQNRQSIFKVHSKNSVIDKENLLDDDQKTSKLLNTETNYNFMNLENKIKEIKDYQIFDFKCKKVAASYDSFACISEEEESTIIFANCLDSKCKNVKTEKIKISDYLKTEKVEKMLVFNNKFIAIRTDNKILYIIDKNNNKIDEIACVDDINFVDDENSRYLLYIKNNILYQYPDKMIISIKNSQKKLNKFESKVFKSKLIVFSNCDGYDQISTNENIIMFCNQENIDDFVVDKNGNIFAIDSKNNQVLICDISNKKCEKLTSIETEKSIQLLPLNRGGFVAISIDNNSNLSYHFLIKQKSKKSKIMTTKTSETADKVFLTSSNGKYPRIFALKNGIISITQCSNSRCLPGFAN